MTNEEMQAASVPRGPHGVSDAESWDFIVDMSPEWMKHVVDDLAGYLKPECSLDMSKEELVDELIYMATDWKFNYARLKEFREAGGVLHAAVQTAS